MTWRLQDIERLSQAAGRKLLRVGSVGEELIELVFERKPGERAELLVTLPVWGRVSIGEIDLAEIEAQFGRQYGLGARPDMVEGHAV